MIRLEGDADGRKGLLLRVMALPDVHLHGPEHHGVVPCVLLTAYRNCGGAL